MTYTYKLARRLAISRHVGMVHVLALLAACAGETTAPDSSGNATTTPVAPAGPVGFRVLPGTVTVETQQKIRFRGEIRTLRGEVYSPRLTWESSGGVIDSAGNFSAEAEGTYRVIGRGDGRGRELTQRPDTSVVLVVRPRPGLVEVRVTPREPQLTPGQTLAFSVIGRLANGKEAPIGVVWTATGGSIDPAGVYHAGSTPGNFSVIASNTGRTVADTVDVRIVQSTDTLPTPTSDP